MPKFRLSLDEGQLAELHDLAQLGLAFRRKCIEDERRPSATATSDPDRYLSAYNRGPRVVALLEEHLKLGPVPELKE